MKRQVMWSCLLGVCLCLGICVSTSLGQAVYGSIFGTVTDPQGNVVAGAKVVVTSVTKGTAFDTATNESGNYSVTHLIPDTYKIHVESAGFKASDIPSVGVSADTGAHVDVQLQVGAVTQSVEVTGEVPQLKTDKSDVATEFNDTYVENLPILNRNFTNLELLTPGTQKLVGWSHAATENPQGGQQIFVDGQHFSGTSFMLDGTDNQDVILGIIVVNPNIDAIQETKITLQNYDAEFGKATAGVITVQTKSGTNGFHGGGFFDYYGNDQNARNPFTNAPGVPLPDNNYKDFGAEVGGPIFKDKLFFFGDYQGVRLTNGASNLYTIPTEEAIKTCNPATNLASDTPGFCNLAAYSSEISSGGGLIYNPATGDANSPTGVQGVGRTPFAGNMIPIADISPQAAKILAAFPTPTSGGLTNNFVANGSGTYHQNAFDTRIDYNAPHGYAVFGRFSLDYFNLSGAGGLGLLGGQGFGPGGLNGESTTHNYSLAAGFDKAIGTSLLTDFRFGFFRYNPLTNYLDAGTNPMTGFGVPGLNLGTSETGGLSTFNLNGFGGFSAFGDGLGPGRCNCPLIEREQQFQFVNNWTKIKGNHQFKFGVDIRFAENTRIPSDSNRTGVLNFDANGTSLAGAGGLSLATMLLGDVTSFQRFSSTSITAAGRQHRNFFYAQDTWRVTSKFTFNYGLRWEIYDPEYVNGKDNGGFGNITQGVIRVAGEGGIGLNGNIDNTYKAFGPRMGIAYQYDAKTVIRMGYGRSFDIGVFGSNFGHAVNQNLPVLAAQSLSDSNFNAGSTNNISPVFTLAQGPPAYPFAAVLADIGKDGIPGTLPLEGPDGTASTYIRPTIQRLPTLDAWNAVVQRQVTSTISVEVGYVGNKGTHVLFPAGPSYNANPPAIGNGTDLVENGALTSFVPFVAQADRRPLFLNGIPAFTYTGSTYTTAGGAVLPTPACCPIDINNYFGNDSSSHYESMEAKITKRFSNGWQFQAFYTFSHSNAFDSSDGSYYTIDPKAEYGPDPYNRDHVFVLTSVYQLPFGKGKRYFGDASRAMDLLVGGWQMSNTMNWSSGLPWTASIGECGELADTGPCRPNLVPGAAQALSLGPHEVTSGCGTGGECGLYFFSPVPALAYNLTGVANGTDSCTLARPVSGGFSLPACGTFGDAGHNTFTGPRAFFSDLSMAKNFKITERVNAEFRFDAFNVFNHPVLAFNSNQGNTCIDCSSNPDAGRIDNIEANSTPGSPIGMRQLEFGLRVKF